MLTVFSFLCLSETVCASDGKKASKSPTKTWTEAVAQIERENNAFRKTTSRTLSKVRKEKLKLDTIKKDLALKTDHQEKTLERQRETFNKMLKTEEKLIEEIAAENEELKTLEGTIRAAAKEADALIRENPTSFEVKGREALVATLLTPDHYPTLDEIRALSELFFKEADLSAQVRMRQGEFIGIGGGIAKGDIIRLGTFTTYYRLVNEKTAPAEDAETAPDKSGYRQYIGKARKLYEQGTQEVLRFWNPDLVERSNTLGFLKPDTTSNYMVAVPQRPPRKTEATMLAWLEGKSEDIPLDVSRGAIFRLLNTEKGLEETVAKGGIIAWIILGIGLLATLIGLERLFVLVRARKAGDRLFTRLLEHANADRMEECQTILHKKRQVPTYRVLKRIMEFSNSDKEVLENAAEEAVMKEMPRLERFLPTLGVLYAIAPLLGLLGTVTGMINTFQVISAFGTGDPKMMSGGISEALITTQLGLAVAVPIMLFHHYLERKVDKVLANMEEKAASLTVVLMEKNETETELTHVDHAA